MKHSLTALILTSLSLSAFSAPVLTDSDTLLLKGSVDKKVSIVVKPELISSTLDLSADTTDLLVAQVEEKANVNAGYKVTITSAHNGKLVNEDDDTYSVSYVLKYNTQLIELVSPSEDNNVVEYETKQLAPIDRAVTISYDGELPENMLAGDYSDTVTFAISAN